jgi:hypothetical protein
VIIWSVASLVKLDETLTPAFGGTQGDIKNTFDTMPAGGEEKLYANKPVTKNDDYPGH